MLFIEICYISNFLTNVAASRKFRAKKIYFNDQNMRLHVNNRTLGLVNDLNDHDILKHQIMKNKIMKQSISEKMQIKNCDNYYINVPQRYLCSVSKKNE